VGLRKSLKALVNIKISHPPIIEACNVVRTATELPQCPNKSVPNDTCSL
jgi:hypothetical protein